MSSAIKIEGPKIRNLNDEMREFFPQYLLRNIRIDGSYRGLDISNADAHVQNLATRNVDYPVRVRGGGRYLFEGMDFQRILSNRRARMNAN